MRKLLQLLLFYFLPPSSAAPPSNTALSFTSAPDLVILYFEAQCSASTSRVMKTPKLTKETRKSLRRAQHSTLSKVKSDRNQRASDPVLKVPKVDPIRQHQQQLLDLEKSDPEFFAFLRENDSNLLNFEDEDEEDTEGMGQGTETGEGRDSISEEVTEVDEHLLTQTLIESKTGSVKALRTLLSIFRAACIPQGLKGIQEDTYQIVKGRFVVKDSKIYERIMSEVFDAAYTAFDILLGLSDLLKDNQVENLNQLQEHNNWKKMRGLVFSFFKSLTFTLSSLATSNSPGEIASYLLSSLEPFIPLLAPLPPLSKNILHVLLQFWSVSSPIANDDNSRIYAYLRLRQMSLMLPGAVSEECFRLIYLSFARTAKSFNNITSSSVLFMSKCIVELYLTDMSMAYQQVFVYVRQLALLLRTTIQKKTAEASKQILSWQYLNCIRLWTRVICAAPSKEDLGDLAFPLAQVVLGVLTAAPSAVHIPMRFHLISCLQQLAAHCQVFIPTASKLFDILECVDLFSKPVPSTELPPTLSHIIRFHPEACSKASIRDMLVSHVIDMLQHDAEIYRYNVGFPEYVLLTIRKLKMFMKKSKITRWRDLCRTLANQLEQQSAQVKRLRVSMGKAPMEITEFEPLLPKNTDVASKRLMKLLADREIDTSAEITVSAAIAKRQDVDSELVKQKSKKNEALREEANGKAASDKGKKVKALKKAIPVDKIPDEVGAFEWSDDEV